MAQKGATRTAKATLLVTFVIVASKVFGFVRDMVLANYFGTSAFSDAYNSAYSLFYIPVLLFNSCITSTLIPQYMKARDSGDLREANRFGSNVMNVFAVLSLIVTFFMLFTAGPLVRLVYSGFDTEKAAITTQLLRIMLPSLVFFVLSIILSSLLNATEHYNAAQLTGFPLSIAMIFAMVVFAQSSGIYCVAWGVFAAGILQVVILLPFLRGSFRYSLILSPSDERLHTLMKLAGPAILAMAVNELNHLIDRWLASTLADGTLAAMSYAFRLITFVTGVLIVPITTVMFSRMSRYAADKAYKAIRSAVSDSIQVIALIVAPIAVIACVMSKDIIRFAYSRGAFGEDSVALTATIFVFYMIGVLFFGLRDFLNRAFHSLSDTRTPMRFAFISVVLNIILNLSLKPFMGANGLALATSISAMVSVILLAVTLKKRIHGLPMKTLTIEMCKIILAAVICGTVSVLLQKLLPETLGTLNVFIRLCIVTGASLIVYAAALLLLRVKQIKTVVGLVKHR